MIFLARNTSLLSRKGVLWHLMLFNCLTALKKSGRIVWRVSNFLRFLSVLYMDCSVIHFFVRWVWSSSMSHRCFSLLNLLRRLSSWKKSLSNVVKKVLCPRMHWSNIQTSWISVFKQSIIDIAIWKDVVNWKWRAIGLISARYVKSYVRWKSNYWR